MADDAGSAGGAAIPDAAAALEAAALDLQQIWDSAVEPIGSTVSPVQLRALMIIGGRGPVSVNALAAGMRASTSATSRLCDRLQHAGLITRVTASGDRRGVILSLSPAGIRLVSWTRARHREALGRVIAAMRPAGRAALLAGLADFRAIAAREADDQRL